MKFLEYRDTLGNAAFVRIDLVAQVYQDDLGRARIIKTDKDIIQTHSNVSELKRYLG